MKTLRKLSLALLSLTIIFSSLLYIGCENDDDNVDDYFDNNPYQQETDRDISAVTPPSSNTPPVAIALSINPGSATVAGGESVAFEASGGTPPYTWSVRQAGHGNVNPASGTHTLYSQLSAAPDNINTVILKDNAGAISTAKIN